MIVNFENGKQKEDFKEMIRTGGLGAPEAKKAPESVSSQKMSQQIKPQKSQFAKPSGFAVYKFP